MNVFMMVGIRGNREIALATMSARDKVHKIYLPISRLTSSLDVGKNATERSGTSGRDSSNWLTGLTVDFKSSLTVSTFCVKKVLNCCAHSFGIPPFGREGAPLSPWIYFIVQ